MKIIVDSRPAMFLLLMVCVTTIGSGPVRAADEDHGKAALSEGGFPWYDSDKGEVKRVNVQVDDEAEANHRDSQWLAMDKDRKAQPNTPRNWPALGKALEGLFWLVLGVLLLALVIALVWAFVKREDKQNAITGTSSRKPQFAAESDRVEDLPFTLDVPRADLLEEARRQYEQGDYRKAIVYLFSYQLIHLDRHQLIRLAKGKTNRQYLREVRRSLPDMRALLERTMVVFEDVFFGDHNLDRSGFETCWRGLDEFHARVQRSTSTS